MSELLFLADFTNVAPGDLVEITGDEARHGVVVRRIRIGERVLVADGNGRAVRGEVVVAEKLRMVISVIDVMAEDSLSAPRLVAVQALAKGERADLAVQLVTELGAAEIVAWPAERSIVRWVPERREKSLAKWVSTAREATKQSRRFRVPKVIWQSTEQLVNRIQKADLALILHQDAAVSLAKVVDQTRLVPKAEILVITGPEGGISPVELAAFQAAGGYPTLVSDKVLRTSTAGGVALAQLQVLFDQGGRWENI